MLMLPVWLVGWTIALKWSFGLLSSVEGPPAGLLLFMAVWIPMWIAGGLWVVRTLAWMLAGKEEMEIEDGFISVRRHVLGLGRTRSYDRSHAQHLRTVAAPETASEFFSGRGAVGGPWHLTTVQAQFVLLKVWTKLRHASC